jgi:hypothetical protein
MPSGQQPAVFLDFRPFERLEDELRGFCRHRHVAELAALVRGLPHPQPDAAVRSLERWKKVRAAPEVQKLNEMRLALEREFMAARRLGW